ncbi:phage major capsid protein [Rhodococcus wratislaviensis]|uniref:phage major capsid protein n=1 Tax=Rhodococcus wratislaviensis TaxID=44752 RepID=UPI0035125CF8
MRIKLDSLRAAIKAANEDTGKLTDRRQALVTAAYDVTNAIKAAGGGAALGDEAGAVTTALTEASTALDGLDTKLKAAVDSAATLRKFDDTAGHGRGGALDTGVRLNLKSAATTRAIVSKMAGSDPLTKAVAASGDAIVGIPLDNTIYEIGKVGTSALDVLPVHSRPPVYGYLRQTTRTNNAAPVAVGAVKPTSVYGVTNIEGRLQVIAHLSEPVDSYWLEDNSSLNAFVTTELQYGLQLAVEAQVIGGSGTGTNLRGILNTSGIQSVPFFTDATATVRRALTAIETVGHRATSIILHPTDWEGIELSRRQDGTPDLGSSLPVDRADTRLWGLNVAVSAAVPVGTGVLFDPTALAVAVDKGVRVQWSESVGDDFSRNQLRARCEGRFGVDVYKPLGIAKVALAAA